MEEGFTLETLPIARYREASALFGEDIHAFVALEACAARRSEGHQSVLGEGRR
jgi:hypothetical protein